MSLAGSIAAIINLKDTRTGDLESAVETLYKQYKWTVAAGTASGEADKLWTDQRTLAASGGEDIDLAGSLTNLFGGSVIFAKIKALIISADSANTNNVRLTRPASNGAPLFLAASDGIDILPGGFFVWAAPGAGVAVTADTGDLIHIANSSGTTGITYDIAILGTSA